MLKSFQRYTDEDGYLIPCEEYCCDCDLEKYCEGSSMIVCDNVDDAIERLSEYENTGLSPEQINRIKAKILILGALSALGLILKIIKKAKRKS